MPKSTRREFVLGSVTQAASFAIVLNGKPISFFPPPCPNLQAQMTV